MASLDLFVDVTSKSLVLGLNSPQPLPASSLPLFVGDTLSLNVYLLKRVTVSGQPNFQLASVPATGLQLQLYIDNNLSAGSYKYYTNQLVWAADASGQFFSANLSLNTADLLTLIGTGSSADAWLRIAYVQNGVTTTVFAGQVKLGVGAPGNPVQVPAGLTPLSAEVAAQTFVPKQSVAGQGIELQSVAGKKFILYIFDEPDGTASLKASPIN